MMSSIPDRVLATSSDARAPRFAARSWPPPSYVIGHAVRIAASVQAVWAVWSDVLNWPAWNPAIRAVRPMAGTTLEPGARFELRQVRLPPLVWTVDDAAPPHGFRWSTALAGLALDANHRIIARDVGVDVMLQLRLTGRGGRLVGHLLAGAARRALMVEGDSLRRRVHADEDARHDGPDPLAVPPGRLITRLPGARGAES